MERRVGFLDQDSGASVQGNAPQQALVALSIAETVSALTHKNVLKSENAPARTSPPP